jgi:hypothetical protein
MERQHFPLRSERRLTPELFDHYVAKARAERAKAVAEFWAWTARWVHSAAARMARPIRPQAAATVRKLGGPTL